MTRHRPSSPLTAMTLAASVAPDLGGRIVEVPGQRRRSTCARASLPRRASRSRPADAEAGTAAVARPAILAFQVLYEIDLAHHAPGRRASARSSTATLSLPATWTTLEYVHGRSRRRSSTYARDLIAGVLRHREEIDREIQQRAPAWPLRQMSAVDRTILRLGLYECRFQHGIVPVKVAINEAIELAKLFGSESLPRFVNGVLGQRRRLREQPTP